MPSGHDSVMPSTGNTLLHPLKMQSENPWEEISVYIFISATASDSPVHEMDFMLHIRDISLSIFQSFIFS